MTKALIVVDVQPTSVKAANWVSQAATRSPSGLPIM